MKKVLLSSVALATAAMASAAVNVNALSETALSSRGAVMNATANEVKQLVEIQGEVSKLVSPSLSSVAKADEESAATPIPFYYAPNGMFYMGNAFLFNYPNNIFVNLYDGTVLLGSPYSSYTWRNASKNATAENKFTWKYLDIAATNAAGAATFKTTNTVNFVSEADNAIFTYSSSDGSYTTYGPALSVEGSDSIYSTGVQYGLDTYVKLNYNGKAEEGFSIVYTYDYSALLNEGSSVSYFDISDFSEETADYYESTIKVPGKMLGYGLFIPQPQAQYGLNGIVFRCAAPKALTDDVRVVVYKVNDEGKITNEVLASGKVAAKDFPWHVTAWSNVYVPMLIEDPDLGDVNTTVNIDCPVFISIQTKDASLSLAGMVGANENQGNSYYVSQDGDDFYIFNLSRFSFTSNATGEKAYLSNLVLGLDVTTSWMEEANGDYAFNAPLAGGSKQFDIDALYRLDAEAGVADIYGEGMDDWYTVDMTSQNVMTVTVKALPEGTAGRSSELVVYTPGSERTFTITQGETTGVDVIGIDNADVINVEYFDLQGRKLNAQPENGIFIQKSLLSNGKTVATKVAK